ncbi:MAG: general secretion pathway protein GspK [Planctomycetaceae bacterium]|nr:general secretion pathway protein GspK [Planctomycetaceae bacterium]
MNARNLRAPWRAGEPGALAGGRNPTATTSRDPCAYVRRRGAILIIAMWIMIVLAAMAMVMCHSMRVEIACSGNELSAAQAQAVEAGAVQYVLAAVDSLKGQLPSETDFPCEAVRLGQGMFWIIRPDFDNDRQRAYGIADEAGKLNLNTATAAMLARLPEMTDELAAAIIDWRDGDSTPAPNGAENEYYLSLKDPYQCKNAPLETVEELFLVNGATEDLLLGEDTNRNGLLDLYEDDGDASQPPDNRDGQLRRGLLSMVTVYSRESNTDAGGKARVNINSAGGNTLRNAVTKGLDSSRATEVLVRTYAGRPFANVLDFYVRSGLKVEEFAAIADGLTTSDPGTPLQGLINVNTAPKGVLACLPGLDDNDAAALVAKRLDGGEALQTIAWVAQALTPAKAAAIGGLITVRTYRFSADIVSVSADGRCPRRCRIVIDAASSPPRVMYRQDLTHLGWPLAGETLEHLQKGGSLDDLVAARTAVQETPK